MLAVRYEGSRSNKGGYRLAVVSFDEANEEKYQRISFLMHIKGWELEQIDFCGQCEVFDRDEYNEFVKDWKEAKNCIINCMKYGF